MQSSKYLEIYLHLKNTEKKGEGNAKELATFLMKKHEILSRQCDFVLFIS